MAQSLWLIKPLLVSLITVCDVFYLVNTESSSEKPLFTK
ncbi:hypothetical protein PANA5342_0467 [Pantoea ananatis LMG 5342]|nr:hypothetical protein PANA5342_0467 [Pantoea ananatis LMG 5342]